MHAYLHGQRRPFHAVRGVVLCSGLHTSSISLSSLQDFCRTCHRARDFVRWPAICTGLIHLATDSFTNAVLPAG
ncbi:hypothetical protein BRADI_3g58715v3 [Brachypodium distachyon]|uniref:Uncharacterized protein n=1 Tax=Brachypodium distachyon TaxID=15368 RepID=A0A2K2D5P4_BRADI|nr:hypothetical protein BRADI_3g58715v3 [Brachypodium distachyon]